MQTEMVIAYEYTIFFFSLLSPCALQEINIEFVFSDLKSCKPLTNQDSSACGQHQGVEVTASLCSGQME